MLRPAFPNEDSDDTTAQSDQSDADLVDRVRQGDSEAYCELWNRHHDAGLRAAAKITRRFDPEDLVQEAFVRILSAICRGRGPQEAFRPYLYATIRNVSMNWTRDETESHCLDDLADVPDPEAVFDEAVLDRTITGRAFASLRSEWRTILWYTAVEGLPPREAGRYLGLSANAAAALAYRAREGLRMAWIQAHVSTADIAQDCQWSVERLGAYKRGQLRTADHDQLEDHLTGCLHCSILVEELDDVADRLRAILLPMIVGPGLTRAADGLGWGQETSAATAPTEAGAVGTEPSMGLVAPAAAGSVKAATALILAAVLGLGGGTAWTLRHVLGDGSGQRSTGALASSDQPSSSGDSTSSGPSGASAAEDTAVEVPPEAETLVAPPPASERSLGEQDPGPAESGAPDAGTVADGQQVPDPADEAAPVADTVDTAPDTAGPTLPGTTNSPQPPTAEDPAPPAGGETDGGSEEQEPPPPEPQPVTPPAPRVDGLAQSLYLPELRGTAEPGADVIAVADGVTLARTTADAQGAWTATLAFDDATADPAAVTVYQEVGGRRSAGTPVTERIVLQAPTVVGVSTAPSPTVTVTGTPGTVVHVAVDGLVTTYQHTLNDQPVVRALLGLNSGPHVVAVRYADPSTGRYGAWARTEFTIP